ncbi:hypothetical protein [Cellulomonas phragmiteti]|uniref:DUF7824 domain-containing protein n=1 Tax=Cellulomonas phragmiteti TaxID=478780 RepID=A0ABQ4DQY7_9CELL|nr:hypothetical protein [Cellulomonas phragmiteti]GIG41770.1 hypothetical protein Cph01nite_35320 [Cellulomonas phragmiteti]
MPPALAAAVEVFRELGWADAAPEDVEHLPLGTPEQQQVARAGLATGDWGEYGQLDARTYGWTSHVGVDEAVLALFAVRVGVDAARAVRVVRGAGIDDELLTRVLAERGPRFARALLGAAYRPVRRPWEHSTTALAGPVVRLVDLHDLPVPDDVEYLRDWVVYAAGTLTGESGDLYPSERGWAPPPVVARRLREHVRAAVTCGVPATGPLGTVLPAAVAQGLLDRDEAVGLALAALDAAQRPGDRKVWAQLLTGPLALTDAEVVAHADALVPVLAHGDAAVISAFAPALVAGVDDDTLADVLIVALPVRTRAVLRTLLTAAAARPRPHDATCDVVAPLVTPHASSPDRALARAAAALTAAWDLRADEPADLDDPDATPPDRWRATPPVWQVPWFEVGEVSGAALTAAAAVLTGRPDEGFDVEVDRFLALANALARTDRDAARTALGGVRATSAPGLASVAAWVAGTDGPWLDRPASHHRSATVHDPLAAREASVVQRLGEVPVLLSTPTWVDLRIDPADLVTRLRAYAASDAVASEADVLLAATRCDLTLATDAVVAALASLPVPVVLQSGAPAAFTAGPALATYLRDPVREPALVLGEWRQWTPEEAPLPASLARFPERLATDRWAPRADLAVFPTWGDAASTGVEGYPTPGTGLVLRQLARRATPLTPGLAVNLLGAQRGLHPRAAADGTAAVHEAWERGLLRPGAADVRLLDWTETSSNLAAFARVCAQLADEGLLSVVWPLLDDLLQVSLRASRLLAGTAEVAEAVRALLPDVRAAVAQGVAPASALDLPGTRALSARGGSSRAVVAARAVATDVPAPTVPAAAPPAAPPGRPFDEVWPAGAGTVPAVVDGAFLTVLPAPGSRMPPVLEVALPDGGTYHVAKSWFYDLEHEGQCQARSLSADASARTDAWLRWDTSTGRLVVSPHRNWRDGRDGPLPGGDVPPLTTSMVAALLLALCQDDPPTYYVESVLREGPVGSAAVAHAMRALVPSPHVSPARMARLVDTDPTTLPVLWPVLVESVRYAATLDGSPPRWLNRVLDVAVHHAATLREAAQRGLLPTDAAAWPGLGDLAATARSATVRRKAATLVEQLGTTPDARQPGP